jgi:hypothetical protein
MSDDPKVLEEQGVLLLNLEKLTQGRSEKGILNTVRDASDEAAASSRYKGFIQMPKTGLIPSVLLLDSRDPSTFSSFLKSRSKSTAFNDILCSMSTFEISSLVPTIRLFKIHFNRNGKQIPIEIPFDTSASGIDDIFKNGVGRGSGAGITSVEWKHNPKNEASAPTYNLNLRIHLQNIEEFFRVRNSAMMDGNELVQVSIQDLLYQTKERRKETGDGTSIYDPDYYKIKLVVGWRISAEGIESIRMNSNRRNLPQFLDALRQQTETMYLSFTYHDLQFNEDGSIDIQINYFGQSDVNLYDIRKSNILVLDESFTKEIQKAQKDAEEKSGTVDSLPKEKSFLENVGAGLDDFFGTGIETSATAEEKLQNLKKGARRRKYVRLVQGMLQKKYIHFFKYNKELIEQYSQLTGKLSDSFKSGASLKTINNFNRQMADFRTRISGKEDTTVATTANLDSSTQQKVAAASISTDAGSSIPPDPASLKADEELIKMIQEGGFEAEIPYLSSDGQGYIAFFYLSSLIDILIEPIFNYNNSVDSNFINKKTRVILGPMTITDYGSLYDSGQTKLFFQGTESPDQKTVVKVYKGKKTTINIGDIPISLKDFTAWFTKNIVDRNLDEMSLNDFLTLLIQELVSDSLTNDVYSFAPAQKVNLMLENFTSIAGQYNETLFQKNIKNYVWTENFNQYSIRPRAAGFRIDSSALQSLRTTYSDSARDEDPNSNNYLPSKDYIVIYSSAESPDLRVADKDIDATAGILHLYYGDSQGLIRNMKFSRIDNPHARAESLLNANSAEKGVSKIVREKYNVNLELFGNTDIQAGTYIHLMPTYPGASNVMNTQRILRDIGLGGYYFVTEVHNSIEIGDFVTKVKGIWESAGDGRASQNIYEEQSTQTSEATAAVVE